MKLASKRNLPTGRDRQTDEKGMEEQQQDVVVSCALNNICCANRKNDGAD